MTALIGLKFIDNLFIDAANSDASLWPLLYLAPALGLATVAMVVIIADRPKALLRGFRARSV